MHRTESGGNVNELYTDQIPATAISASSLNAIQEELCNIVEDCGLTLNTAAQDDAGLRTQVYDALISDQHLANMGITATKAELNIMDGVTATATEINTVCDGNTAKNAHTHLLASGATDITESVSNVNAVHAFVLSRLNFIKLVVGDDSEAGKINAVISNRFNFGTNVSEDHLAKGVSGTYYILDASGGEIIIKEAATGILVQYGLICSVEENDTGTALCAQIAINTGQIEITFTNAASGVGVDLTSLVDTGKGVVVGIGYVEAIA